MIDIIDLEEDFEEVHKLNLSMLGLEEGIKRANELMAQDKGILKDPTITQTKISIAHAREVAEYLGVEMGDIESVSNEDIEITPTSILRVSMEAKADFIARAMGLVVSTFRKLWNTIKKITAKAIVLFTNTEKKYDKLIAYIDNKKVSLKQGEDGVLTKDEITDIYNRLALYFMIGNKLKRNEPINMNDFVTSMIGIPGFTLEAFDAVINGTKSFLSYYGTLIDKRVVEGADELTQAEMYFIFDKLNEETTTLFAKAASFSYGDVTDTTSKVKNVLAERKGKDDDFMDAVYILKANGKNIRYVTRKVTVVYLENDTVAREVYNSPAEYRTAYKFTDERRPIFGYIELGIKTTTLDDDFLTTLGYKDNIELLDIPSLYTLSQSLAIMSKDFKSFSSQAMEPGKQIERTLSNNIKDLNAFATKLDTVGTGTLFGDIGKAILQGHQTTTTSVSRVMPGITLDLILGYLGMFNAIAYTIYKMGSKYEDKVETKFEVPIINIDVQHSHSF